jgi:hypothetical protein
MVCLLAKGDGTFLRRYEKQQENPPLQKIFSQESI